MCLQLNIISFLRYCVVHIYMPLCLRQDNIFFLSSYSIHTLILSFPCVSFSLASVPFRIYRISQHVYKKKMYKFSAPQTYIFTISTKNYYVVQIFLNKFFMIFQQKTCSRFDDTNSYMLYVHLEQKYITLHPYNISIRMLFVCDVYIKFIFMNHGGRGQYYLNYCVIPVFRYEYIIIM